MTQDIKFRFTTETGGNPKQVFTMLQKGFRDVAKGLQETAKQLLDLQKTDAAEAIGHVSLSINKFAASLTGIPEKAKKVTTELKLLEKTEKEMAQSSKLAQQAWALLKKQIDDGSISLKGARSQAMQYQKAWDKLVADVRVAGGSIKSINKDIDLTGIAAMQSQGHLKLVGGAFKAITAEGYKYLLTNNKVRDSVRELHQSTSLYHTTVRDLSKITFNAESYVKAAEASKQLAQAVGHSEAKFKNIAPVIKNTEINLTKYGTAQKALLGTTASWIKEVDRVAIVNQNLANTQAGVTKHIDVTAKSIKILSMQGLKPFAGLSLDVAQKLGMLDSNFDKFTQSMHTVRQVTGKSREEILKMSGAFLTTNGSFKEAAKAVEEYIKKTIGIQRIEKEIKLLTTRYSELTQATDKHGVSARKFLAVLAKEPGQLAQVKIELSKLNAERNKEIIETKKSETEYIKLSAQYRLLLASQTSYGAGARKIIETLKLTGTSLVRVRTDLARFNEQLKEQTAITTLTKKYSELMASTDRYGKGAQRLVALLRQKPEYMNRITIALSKLNVARNAEIAATTRAREAHETLSVTYRRLLASQTKWGIAARDVIATLHQKGVSVSKVKAQLNGLHGEMNSLNNITNRLAKSFRTYGSYMISSSIMMGVIRAFRGAAAAIRDYSQGLQDIQAITKATSIEMMRMDKALLDVVKNTKFSVQETATAMKTLGQAGFSAKQVIEGIPNVANLATGTLESLGSAVDLVSTAVYTFRMGMDQTAKVADMFANAVTNSRLTVSKLNIAMNYIGPLAKAAGISLQDTNAAMMLLANSGLRASTIGTGFRRVLTLLLKPTSAFRNAVVEAGYSMDDFNPLLHDFSSIIEKLPKIVQNSQHAVEMFGVRGSSVITAFTTQGSAEFERLKETLNVTGTASWMAAVQMEGLGLQVKNFQDRLGALAVAIGKAGVEDGLKMIVNAGRSLVAMLTELVESSFGKFIIGLGLMGVASGTLYTSIGLLGRNFAWLTTQINLTNAAALRFALNPIGLAIAGITAAAAALAYAWQAYKSSLEDTMVENANLSASLQTVSEKIMIYNQALETNGRESKEAREAALDLKETIEKSGESSKKAKAILEEYGKQIDKNSGYIENHSKFVRELANEITNELEEAYWNVAKAAEAAHILQEKAQTTAERWIPGLQIAKKFIAQLSFEIGYFYDKLANSWLGGALAKSFGWVGKQLTDLAISFNKFSNFIGLGGPTGIGKSFDELKKAAEGGSEAAERALVTITAAAKVTANSLLAGRDASNLTREELRTLAIEWGKLNKSTPAGISAVIEALEEQKQKSTELKEAYATLGTSITSAYKVGREELSKFNVTDAESLRKRQDLTNKHVEQIRRATEAELGIKLDAQVKELLNFKGTEEEKTELRAAQVAEVLALNKQHLDAEQNLLQSQKQHLVKHYKEQVEATEQYYNDKKSLIEQNQTLALEKLDEESRQNQLRIAKKFQDEEQQMNASIEASMEYNQKRFELTVQHLEEMDALNEESIQRRITAERALGESTDQDHKVIKAKIAELNREILVNHRGSLQERRKLYEEYIGKLKEQEKSLSEAIEAEKQKRRDFDKSLEDTLRDLKYKTLTDEQIHQAEITRAQKLQSEARQHIVAGEFDSAKQKASEAMDVYKGVANSLKKQGDETESYARSVRDIGWRIKDVGKLWHEASNGIDANMENNKTKTGEFIGELEKGMEALDTRISKTTESLMKFGLDKVDVDVSEALESINKLDIAIKKVTDRKIELGIHESEKFQQKLKEAADSLDSFSENPVTVNFDATGSSTKPITEKLQEIKGALEDTFKLDDSLLKHVVAFSATVEGSQVPIMEALQNIAEAFESINEYADYLSKEGVDIAIEIAQYSDVVDKIDEVGQKLSDLDQEWKAHIGIGIPGLASLQSAWDLWNKLVTSPAELTKTVNIKENVRREYTTGEAPGHAVGTRIPGYGGGDIVDARLEPGEWVIRKEAVQKYGDNFMAAVNAMKLSKPGFQSGGRVSTTKELEKLERNFNALLGATHGEPSPERNKELMDLGRKIQEVKSTNKAVKDNDSGGNFYTVPDWDSLISPYYQSNDIRDLYRSINQLANILDTDLTNIGMAVGTGVAGAGLLAKSGIVAAPQSIMRGYYGAEGPDTPNRQELMWLINKSGSNLSHGSMSGAPTQQAYDYLKKLVELWNSQASNITSGRHANSSVSNNINVSGEKGSFFTGHMMASDLYDEKGRVLDWEELRKKAVGYQAGGRVLGSNTTSATSVMQKGAKQVSQPSGPSHTVNFQLGGEVHGPFQSDGPTVEGFIETLRIHQMRA